MTHRMKWDDLQFILEVAETGSLSAAARKLGVNHATVLRRVSGFEEKFNVKLFERKPNGYLLTPHSKQMLNSLRLVNKTISSLERSIGGLGTPFEGPIRITSVDSICQEFLVPHIQALGDLHPNLEIELYSTNHRLDLGNFDADITIRPTNELTGGLIGEKTGSMRFGVYGTPDYWQQNPSNDVLRHRWLGVSELLIRSPVGVWQTEMLGSKLALRSDSFLTLREFAENGMGAAMLPCLLGVKSDGLIPSPQFDFVLETNLWVATHRDLAETPRIQALLQYFINIFETHANELRGLI